VDPDDQEAVGLEEHVPFEVDLADPADQVDQEDHLGVA